MKIAMLIVRTLMGLLFIVSSMVYFLMVMGVFPAPPLEGTMKTFNDGLAASGYFFTLLKVTEFVCGVMLLTGRFVPLALVILSPIIINIFMVHLLIDRSTLPVAIGLVVANIFLAWYHWGAFKPLLRPKYDTMR